MTDKFRRKKEEIVCTYECQCGECPHFKPEPVSVKRAHGYPNCECDLEGGDPNCDIQPPYVSLKDAYDATLAENSSLRAGIEVFKTELEQQIELLHAAAEDYRDERASHAITRKALDLIVDESKFNTWETRNHPWDAQGWIEEARAALADTEAKESEHGDS